MINLPVKGSTERVEGIVRGDCIQIQNSNGYWIEQIYYNPAHLESLACTIARLITEARDAGFEQGRKHVRAALGI